MVGSNLGPVATVFLNLAKLTLDHQGDVGLAKARCSPVNAAHCEGHDCCHHLSQTRLSEPPSLRQQSLPLVRQLVPLWERRMWPQLVVPPQSLREQSLQPQSALSQHQQTLKVENLQRQVAWLAPRLGCFHCCWY